MNTIQQVNVTMDKGYTVWTSNMAPVSPRSHASLLNVLASRNFNMLTIEFDTYCYADAPQKLRDREYSTYTRRINRIAKGASLSVELIENKVIDGHTFPHKYTAVLMAS